MAFRFKLDEGFGKGLARIGGGQFERAMTQLESSAPDVAVHETRKCMKRLRALLRLVRPGIGETEFRTENARLRDIARLLSASRDRDVLRSTAARLAAESRLAKPVLVRLQASISAPGGSGAALTEDVAAQALARLGEARERWGELQLEPDDISAVAEGLATGLRRLKSSIEAAAAGDDDAVHDWRKAIQHHWRHMRLMQAGWPAYYEARAVEARTVSELLGAAQDLTLLLGHVEGEAGGKLAAKQVGAITAAATEKRSLLRAAAFARSTRLVAEGADGLARRTSLYWAAAARVQACDVDMPGKSAGPKVEKRAVSPARKAAAKVMATRGPNTRASRSKSVPAKVGRSKSGRSKPARRKSGRSIV